MLPEIVTGASRDVQSAFSSSVAFSVTGQPPNFCTQGVRLGLNDQRRTKPQDSPRLRL